jgi:ABC-type glycerol-3-phosphate transport system permease component
MSDEPWWMRAGIAGLCLVLCLTMIYPLVWNVMAALKSNADLVANPFGLPLRPQWENIASLWLRGAFLGYLRNSLLISTLSVAGIAVMAAMAGFAFARSRQRLLKLAFGLVLLGLMFPGEVIIVPVFQMISGLGLRNTLLGPILIYLTWTPFGIILLQTYFLSLPTELGDAARIDGCSEYGLFWRIYLPLARPALATIIIFNFIWTWNDFLWPLILLQKPSLYTIQLGVLLFQDQWSVDWALRNAGLVFAILPPLLFYLIFNRGIQRGLLAGAVKM